MYDFSGYCRQNIGKKAAFLTFLKSTVFITRTDVFSDAHDEMLVNMHDQSPETQYALHHAGLNRTDSLDR